MQRLVLLLAMASGCAELGAAPDPWFTCDWARFRDFGARAEHPGTPRLAPLLCGPADPTAPGFGSPEGTRRPPASRRNF